jgi:hypothetical protein
LLSLAILGIVAFGATLDPGPARAQPPSGFVVARLKYEGGGDWYDGPSTLTNLARGVRERTPIPVDKIDEARVSLADEDLFNYPFIYMTGHGNVHFSDADVERLRRYLASGGFLFVDDDYGLDQSFRRELARVFPDRKLVDIPFDNPIYHCFYDFPHGPPKIMEHDGLPAEGMGIFDGSRLVIFYAYQTDIGDGLEDAEVHGNPPEKREEAMKMAINVVVYALTH